MEYRILGPLEVIDNGRELMLGPAKERAILGLLLLHAGSVVSRTQLIDGLWGESPPPTAGKAVNVYMSQVRKTLSGNGDGAIVTRTPGYVLDVDAEMLDARRFQRLATAAREREAAGELEGAAALMRGALGLWRGPALAGVELEGEALDDVARLEELRVAAELDLNDYELALGHHEQLVPELERLVAQHPLDERLRGQLMLALYRSGRQADALRVYRDTREALVDQLGIEPSASLQRLERGILNHDSSLEAPAGVAHPRESRSASLVSRRRLAAALVAGLGAAAVCAGAGFHLLAGRDHPLRVGASTLGLIDSQHTSVISRLALDAQPVGLAVGGRAAWLTTAAGTLVHADLAHPDRASSLVLGDHPGALTLADGSVWLLEPDRGALDRVDPSSGRVVQRTHVGNGPVAIAPGFGSLWVANETDGTLVRVDQSTGRRLWSRSVGQAPDGVAVGAGSVWVSDGSGGAVTRVQPTKGKVIASIPVGSAPGGLAFGGGSVWVANRDDGTVSRIDPSSNSVRGSIRIGRSADGVSASDRSLWAISTTDRRLEAIDIDSGRVQHRSELGSAPGVVAAEGGRLAVATLASVATHRGGTLKLIGGSRNEVENPVTLDPATWWTTTGWGLLAVTNDGLLTFRRTSGTAGTQVVPDLARTMPLVARGGTSYTFQLRSGMRYSNGRPVRPSDVRASIERLWKLRSTATTNSDLRLGLVGEPRCARRPRLCDLSRGIRVDDAAMIVTFRLARPNPAFLRLLALPFYDVLPAGTPARDRELLPATGPYRITRFAPGRLVELERNPRFRAWSAAAQPPGYPERIVWHIGATDRAALEQVLAGHADYSVDGVPAGSTAAVARRHAASIQNESVPWLSYAFLNTRTPPFTSAEARRALALAVDRRVVVKLAGGPLVARQTCQVLPPSFPGYRPWCGYTIDPNTAGTWNAPDLRAARALVRMSGTRGAQVVVWTKRDPSQPGAFAIGRYLAGLLNTLGYRATLRALPLPRYYAYIADSRNRAQIGVANWVPAVLDPSSFFEPQLTCNAYEPDSTTNVNFAGYCDTKTDAEIRRAEGLETTDLAAANGLWAAVDRRISSAAPFVPLYSWRWSNVLSARVGNYEFNPVFGFLIDQAWVR